MQRVLEALRRIRPESVRQRMPFGVISDTERRPIHRATHFVDTLGRTRPRRPPHLLIVITTYRRSESLLHTFEKLSEALQRLNTGPDDTSLLIVEDPSEEDYGRTRRRAATLFAENVLWLRAERHLGKVGFWRTYQAAFSRAKALKPEFVLFLQDDLEFEPRFLTDALTLFADLKSVDNRRRKPQVLNLYAAKDDEPAGRWVNVPRRDVDGLPARHTQWFDLAAFLIEAAALEKLHYRVHRVPEWRWKEDPTLSSGVGRQLTRRLRRHAVTYQCFPPLVFHGSEESRMNPQVRALRPLDNRDLQNRAVCKEGADYAAPSPRLLK